MTLGNLGSLAIRFPGHFYVFLVWTPTGQHRPRRRGCGLDWLAPRTASGRHAIRHPAAPGPTQSHPLRSARNPAVRLPQLWTRPIGLCRRPDSHVFPCPRTFLGASESGSRGPGALRVTAQPNCDKPGHSKCDVARVVARGKPDRLSQFHEASPEIRLVEDRLQISQSGNREQVGNKPRSGRPRPLITTPTPAALQLNAVQQHRQFAGHSNWEAGFPGRVWDQTFHTCPSHFK